MLRCNILWINYRIQIKLPDDLIKSNAVDLRDQLFLSRLARIKRQKDVLLIYVCQSCKAFISVDPFLKQKILICPVPINDRGLWQKIAE